MTTNSPYKFEPGMRVMFGGSTYIVAEVKDDGCLIVGGGMWLLPSCCSADPRHPGTRGLVLQQYRDASGYPNAQPARGADGRWRMCPRPFTGDEPTGEGESEGACIIDALTRLARGDDHGIFVASAADARVAAIVFAPVVRSSITAGELAMMSLAEVKELAGGARIVRTDDAFTLYRDGSPQT